MIKHLFEQHSEAWHDIRVGKFTASRFNEVVAGESTDTYKKLILSLAGEIISGIKEPSYSNYDMERGTELEPLARIEYESLFDLKVEQVGFISPENEELREWVGISPDGLINDSYGLEIKCPRVITHLNYIKAGKLPNEYKWQVQGSLLVTGLPYWDFMSYYPNMKPFIIRVFPDKEMHAELETRLLTAINDVKDAITNYNAYDFNN